VVLATRGHGTPEMTSPFELFRSLLNGLSVGIVCLSLSIERLSNIFHLAEESALGIKFGVLWDFKPFGEVW
jgi:hypothetical protein